jgi:hypothetical protein
MDSPRKRVQILSPLRGTPRHSEHAHRELAKHLARTAALEGGVAPFVPHLLYPSFLADHLEAERRAGIESSKAWLAAAEEVWCFDLWGLSEGMREELEELRGRGVPVRFASRGEIPAWRDLAVEVG